MAPRVVALILLGLCFEIFFFHTENRKEEGKFYKPSMDLYSKA